MAGTLVSDLWEAIVTVSSVTKESCDENIMMLNGSKTVLETSIRKTSGTDSLSNYGSRIFLTASATAFPRA